MLPRGAESRGVVSDLLCCFTSQLLYSSRFLRFVYPPRLLPISAFNDQTSENMSHGIAIVKIVVCRLDIGDVYAGSSWSDPRVCVYSDSDFLQDFLKLSATILPTQAGQ